MRLNLKVKNIEEGINLEAKHWVALVQSMQCYMLEVTSGIMIIGLSLEIMVGHMMKSCLTLRKQSITKFIKMISMARMAP